MEKAGIPSHAERPNQEVAGVPTPATHPHLSNVLAAAERLSTRLINPTLLISLHRDLEGLKGKDGKSLARSAKQHALRWGIFTMVFAALEGFFNDALTIGPSRTRTLPVSPDKLRAAGDKLQVKIFTNDWGVRTVTPGRASWSRPRWRTYIGSQDLRLYLGDLKSLRDRLSHGGDAASASNDSLALWPVSGGHSMSIMGVEGFIQATTDLAAQTILAFGGDIDQAPSWPEPQRSGLSAEKRPQLPLLA
ncbi:MAG: hypothetical protein LBE60_16700 [Microbacterium sp.]|jgi:hypothetical protein|uniref:hypothetical protein n=1 Tax=Microbacterium sp. TaxID=51671 RepID=UPI00282A606A|nr:hypothetical protein [Microbacterium sp.]MDR2323276.1 hypothetical protein [Microbacterium sp.]